MKGLGSAIVSGCRAVRVRFLRVPLLLREAEGDLERRFASGAAIVTGGSGEAPLGAGADCACAFSPPTEKLRARKLAESASFEIEPTRFVRDVASMTPPNNVRDTVPNDV